MPDQIAKPSLAPTNKVIAATGGSAFGAAISTLLLYLVGLIGFVPPENVVTAITLIVTAVFTGGIAWLVPPGANEAVTVVDGAARTAVRVPPTP